MAALKERAHFHADLQRANDFIDKHEALMDDGEFKWLDTDKLPAEFCEYYSRLSQFGYANGYI